MNSVYAYGSTGRIVQSIHQTLLQEGHESFVIYGRKQAIGTKHKSDTKDDENVFLIQHSFEQKMDIVSSVLMDTHGLHSKKNTETIIAKIKEIDPDVIHLHNIHGFYVHYPTLFAFLKTYSAKVVWTLHDCWSYTGFCAYYDFNQCDGWKNGCLHCKYRKNYPYRIGSNSKKNLLIKKECYTDLNVVLVVPSKWLQGEVQQSILQEKECRVIHNTVNLDAFYFEETSIRSQYHLENKRVYLACANLWTVQKGLEECRKLSHRLHEDEVLVMIGATSANMKGFSKHALAIGHTDQTGLRSWYSACDCFVNCTLEDNYPTVNLEARACGAPIVTYDTGGSKESAGEHAMYVPTYDLDALLEHMRKAKRIDCVVDRKASMEQEYIDLYKQLCQKGETYGNDFVSET